MSRSKSVDRKVCVSLRDTHTSLANVTKLGKSNRDGIYDSTFQGVGGKSKPPCSNTGAEITIHWLRGGYQVSHEVVQELIDLLDPGSYLETLAWGRFMYQRHHVYANGIKLYFGPLAPNMPPCLIDCSGTACEALGFEKLQAIARDSELTRIDIAFDGAPFTPKQAAAWVREKSVRCRAKRRQYREDLNGGLDGETLYLGSRQSSQLLRVYDSRGFTRVELELKHEAAKSFKAILMGETLLFAQQAVGVLREFVDFVDTSSDTNVTRAPLLPLWQQFTKALERVKLKLAPKEVKTLEQVRAWLEHQVSAMLYTYHRSGGSISGILNYGREHLKSKHLRLLRRGVATP